jgi:hypothetical protein
LLKPGDTIDIWVVDRARRATRLDGVLARVFGADGFAGAHCGVPMALRCLVLAPPATTKSLFSLAKGTAPE